MANNTIQLKRTSTTGRTPNTTSSANTQYINAGELALNMTDGILYSSNGTALITVGSNLVNQSVTGTLTANNINVNGVTTYSANVVINNNVDLNFKALSGANVSFIQQNDDNFVMYSTNTTGGQRAIWAIYANSVTSAFNLVAPMSISSALSVGGSNGTSGQVLTSNGSSAPYWSTVSGGSGSVNVAAQYTWTNTQTFSANISFTGSGIGLTTNTSSIYFAGVSDANWRIGRNTGATTKLYYTNNSLDIIAANSNLEGIAFGFTGNSYLETGYAGTFTRNPIYVGNTTVNLAINSTSISTNSIVIASPNTATFYNYNGQVNPSNNFTGNAYAVLGGYGGNILAFGQTNTFHQWIQSGFPSAASPVYYNILLNPLGGNVGIGNSSPTVKLEVAGAVNATSYNIGTTLVANTTGAYHTGTINAASHTTTGVTANVTGVFLANTASLVVGNATVNTVISQGVINTTSVVNAASYTIGTTLIGNTTGIYHTGTINAASHTVGTAFIANSSQVTLSGIPLSANAGTGSAGQLLTSNGATGAPYWSTPYTFSTGLVNTSGTITVNSSYIATLSANNASYLGGTAAASYVTTSTIGGLTANNASYLGGTAAASYVTTSTIGGLTANNTTYFNGVASSGYIKRGGNIGNANLSAVASYSNTQVVGFDVATNGPGVSYGSMLIMNERSDTSAQFVIDYASGHAYTRGIHTALASLSAWNTLLDNNNYSSYALPLSGGTVTGALASSARIYTGYDSATAGSMSCSNWFRTSGATGLYFSSYGRGISPSDGYVSYGNHAVYGSGLNGWQGMAFTSDNKTTLMGNGSTQFGVYNAVSAVWMWYSDYSGNFTAAQNITAYSDTRLKNNIRPIENPIDRRNTLAKGAITYERDGRTRIGYAAQTLRDNGCSEFVLESDDSLKIATGLGTLSVDYGETTAVLAVASKMTDDRVDQLEKRISELEEIIKKLTKEST